LDPAAKLPAGGGRLFELGSGGPTAWNQQNATNSKEREAQLGHDREGSQRSGGRNVEGLPAGPVAVLLEASIDHGHVVDVELGGCRSDPVEPAPLGVDQGEGCPGELECERQAGQAGARPEVDPPFARTGLPDRRQAQGVVEVAFPEPRFLPWAEKAEPYRIAVRSFEFLELFRVRLERGHSQ